MKQPAVRAVLLAALCAAGHCAWGHDSWISVSRAAWRPDAAVFELGTGTRYPLAEVAPPSGSVALSGCSDGREPIALAAGRQAERTLELAASLAGKQAPLACWLQLQPAEIELEPAVVQVYFKDIRAPDCVRTAWARMQLRGVRWHETYRKFARIELAPDPGVAAAAVAAARRPVGMELEIVLLGDQPLRAGEALEFQVLRDGHPLAGFPVELVSDRSPVGIWQVTDGEGKLRHRLPFDGQWLLRGTELRLSSARPDTWDSRFVTLVVETAAAH